MVSLGTVPLTASGRPLAAGGLYVASKSGSVYYYPWCSGAQKIQPGNQVWFADAHAAENAGYAPSKGCKGLGSE